MNALPMLIRCGVHQTGDGYYGPTGTTPQGSDQRAPERAPYLPPSDEGMPDHRALAADDTIAWA